MSNFKDISGNKYGRLTALRVHHKEKRNGSSSVIFWECICDCGNLVIKARTTLYGNTNSCGCLRKEMMRKKMSTHGMTYSRFAEIWRSMKKRCQNSNSKFYHNYGGRGIKVDPTWLTFEGFLNDMYDTYIKHAEAFGEKQTTLERVDVNGNYTKSNCTWVTKKQQSLNLRKNIWITFDGVEMHAAELARKLSVPTTTMWRWVKAGLSAEQIRSRAVK